MSVQELRVWWIPQVPMKPFHVWVKDVDEATLLLTALADYDKFQYDNDIKPDYCNAGGLEEYDEQEEGWYEWYSLEGDDINDVIRYEAEEEGTDA